MSDTMTNEASGLPLERVEQELRELAAHLDAGACRFLLLLAEFDERRGWADWGCRSAAQWLSWRCGIGLVAGRQKVKVAHALTELPLVGEAFSKGEISYSKVRAVVRVAKDETEATLLEWARTGTAEHVERICRARRRVDVAEANDIHARRSLTWRWDEDGSFVLRGRLPAEDGAVVLAALDALLADSAESPVHPETDSAESPATMDPPAARRADALVHMAELTLAGGTEGAPGGEHTPVVVHVDAETLVGHDDDGECSLEDGPAIAPETARRLACSAEVFMMVKDAKGQVLSLGRTR